MCHNRSVNVSVFMCIYTVHILLIIHDKNLSCFSKIALQPLKFFGEILHRNTIKACKN